MTTVLTAATTASPGASSQATASILQTAGHGFVVALVINRAAAPTATLTGWGVTWTNIADFQFVSTTRRILVWVGIGNATAATALTFSYAGGVPDTLDWIVSDLGPTTPAVVVPSSVKVSTPPDTFANGTLWELVTLNTTVKTLSYPVAIAAGNTNNATELRFELAADTVGDADWTKDGVIKANTPTRTLMLGSRPDMTDRTPGVMAAASTTGAMVAFEVDVVPAGKFNRNLRPRGAFINSQFY